MTMGPDMEPAADLKLEDLAAGAAYCFEVLVTEKHLDDFAALTGDYSPVHMDTEFARSQGMERRVAHGVLISGFLSRMIGMRCPGRRALLHSLNIRYHNPVYPGDEIVVSGEIEHVSEAARTITVQLSVTKKSSGLLCAKGKAQVGIFR